MTPQSNSGQIVELTQELPVNIGVRFDPERVTLQGVYADQLSAYRAKRGWIQALERCFLLEVEHDYKLKIEADLNSGRFALNCNFETACARYAFWRLTNEQAPEAQYMIETAHIPECESRQGDLIEAPDLESIDQGPLVLKGKHQLEFRPQNSPIDWIRKLITSFSHLK